MNDDDASPGEPGPPLSWRDVPTRLHGEAYQPRVAVVAGRWRGRTGRAVAAVDTRPGSNGGLLVVVHLDATRRASNREVQVRLGSLCHVATS